MEFPLTDLTPMNGSDTTICQAGPLYSRCPLIAVPYVAVLGDVCTLSSSSSSASSAHSGSAYLVPRRTGGSLAGIKSSGSLVIYQHKGCRSWVFYTQIVYRAEDIQGRRRGYSDFLRYRSAHCGSHDEFALLPMLCKKIV